MIQMDAFLRKNIQRIVQNVVSTTQLSIYFNE